MGHKKGVIIIIGIISVLILGYVIYAVFLKDSEQFKDFLAGSENQAESEATMVTVPFEAEFAMHYVAAYEDIDLCGNLPWMRTIVEGTGTEPNLGKFNVHMEFCVQSSTGVYLDLTGYFVPAEGDSLFVTTWGQIVPPDENDPPYYINKWEDPFEFTGGAGRFKGATGGGVTHCYNSTEDDLNHHNWEGTLTMKAE